MLIFKEYRNYRADKLPGKASEDLQEKIKDHIQRNHCEDIEWFFYREHEVAWKKAMGSRFQKEELLADVPSLALKLLVTFMSKRSNLFHKCFKKISTLWKFADSL